MLLGYPSVQTTERYLGTKQNLVHAGMVESNHLGRDPDARVAVTDEELESWIQEQR